MKTLNWKFWTWPAQIRHWRERAELAQRLLAKVTAELAAEKQKQQNEAYERHRRGLHRANM